MPKCFYAPFNKYCLSFLIHNEQSLAAFLKIALLLSFIYTFHLMMDTGDNGKHITENDVIQSHDEEKDKNIEGSPEQKASVKDKDLKSIPMKKPREVDKHKKISSTCNRPTHQRKYFWPPAPPKRKPAPAVSICMSNPQAQVVLEERKVEIKDLESQVVYLQKQIKELKAENRTLLDVQNRQSKELKKYCKGVSDIPALIRSHNDEIKAIQSRVSAVRKELSVCQSDLKSKNESLLKKDQESNKLKLSLRNSEQNVQEMTVENRRLERENKKLVDETKKLLNENEELKSKSEKMQKTIQHLTNKMKDLEETLTTDEDFKNQLKDDLKELQKKYDEALKNEISFKKSLEVPKVMSTTQTDKVETVHAAMMTLDVSKEPELLSSKTVSIGVQASQDEISPPCRPTELRETEKVGNSGDENDCCLSTAFDVYPDIFQLKESTNSKPPSQARRSGIRKPVYPLFHDMSKDTSEVKNSYRDSTLLPSYELLKRPPGLIFDKKSVPLSNNVQYNTAAFGTKGPLNKSDISSDSALNLGFKASKDIDDDLRFYYKESTSKNILRKSSNRMESFSECSPTGRIDIQNDIGMRLLDPFYDTPVRPRNSNKSSNNLFLNSTSKQNTMYPNG